MDDHDDLRAWMHLLRTPGLGACGLRECMEKAGNDARAALADLRARSGNFEGRAREWLRRPDEHRIDADLAWLTGSGNRLLRFTEADFPPLLEAIPQPPAALFVAGDASLLLRPQVAIVGARQASRSGLGHAEAFAAELARAGFVITSGLADGIDGAAHRATLDAGLPTIAVVGTGLDLVYPRKHAVLARRVATGGALVSEYPLGTPARAGHFPRRNRILAGLALGTLVVEAGLPSGSLVSARLAAEQGREVFALPGSIHNPLARGCHQLIRDGARLVESARELVELLAPQAVAMGVELAARLDGQGISTEERSPPADTQADSLLEAMGHDPIGLDELAERTGQSAATLGARLLMLELDGRVETLAGNRYMRLSA